MRSPLCLERLLMSQPEDSLVRLDVRDAVLVARPFLPLDAEGARDRVVAAISAAAAKASWRLVLDVSGWGTVGEDEVALAADLASAIHRHGGRLAVVNDDESWAWLMGATGFDSLFQSFPSVEEAVAHAAAGLKTRPARLAVMLSGGGRSLMNLLDSIDRSELRASVDLVIASGPCAGVERAQTKGLQTKVVPGVIDAEALQRMLDSAGIDLVVLAGYLKMVSVPERYRNRIINIHPALLPKFGGKGMHGLNVHAAVLAAGETESGCTVHACDETYDTGAIILQRRCPVEPSDTAETLAARVFEQERLAYPEAIRRLLRQMGFVQPPEQ